ncbi:MAG: hypothetical protein QOH12_1800 [Solirubrobacteraceae bacterium]|jgi:hypothetical protein|nr:hypothetical protein [Solirubrobacteraceae bacterium]
MTQIVVNYKTEELFVLTPHEVRRETIPCSSPQKFAPPGCSEVEP